MYKHGFFNRWFLDPIVKKAYPEDMLSLYSRYQPLDYIRTEDLDTISAPIDFLGINYYSRKVLKADPSERWLGAKVQPVSYTHLTLPTTERV